MEVLEELQNQGWYLSKEGYDIISENQTVRDRRILISNAVNTDIKDIGTSILSNEIKQGKIGKVILQIQKIRNISAPKSKEESQAAPRMLKLTLTDGHTSCQAVEISSINSLSYTHTSPGSKLLINSAKVSSSCILLNPTCCTLLNGKVPALYEKWELAKNVSQHVRTTAGADGPPPWVNFGEKVASTNSNETFKSLAIKATKETKNEFDVQRQDAIAVASTGAIKKVFGGGSKNIPLKDNRKYFNKGNNQSNQETRGFKGKRDVKENVAEKQQKPSDKISLFDFFEDKLVSNEVVDVKTDNSYVQKQQTVVQPKLQKYKPRYNNYVDSPIDSVTKSLGKVSIESQFASRTLRQHLNLSNNRSESSTKDGWGWKIGDLCMAKYWEDGKYYNAVVTDLTQRTCVVQFNGYGNVEEVLKVDCIPINEDSKEPTFNGNNNNFNYKGSTGYRNNRRQYNSNRTFNKVV